jgi:hypothetical protein
MNEQKSKLLSEITEYETNKKAKTKKKKASHKGSSFNKHGSAKRLNSASTREIHSIINRQAENLGSTNI